MIFGDTSPGAFLCVYVGRISKEKRLDVIVEAVKNIPGAYLAIIGDGPSASMYAATHGKESRIYCKPRFLSHLELAEIYASSDLHVSASQFETLGNTVLEAFACGIPVVVPRCQGFCDTVLDNMDGFLFEPGNSSSAQGFIEVLKNDPEKRLAMGEHGRKVVSSHTVGHVVKDLIAWYKRGIEKQRGDSFTDTFFVFCALLATVPIAIIALWCYERLVREIEIQVVIFMSYYGCI
jgi:glycosyltransferase involved in cell wall biosynthesis